MQPSRFPSNSGTHNTVTINSNLLIGKDNKRELKKWRKYEISMGGTI